MGILSLLISGGIVAMFFTMPIATFQDPTQTDPVDGDPIWRFFIKPGPLITWAYIHATYENPSVQLTEAQPNFPIYAYYIMLVGLGIMVVGSIISFISLGAKKKGKLRTLMGLTMFTLFLGGGAVAAGTSIIMAWIPAQTLQYILLENFAVSDLNYSYPIYTAIIGSGLVVILSIIGLIGVLRKK